MLFQIADGLLFQIADGLAYLHSNEKLMHGNLTPSSIMITKRLFWKIAGLGFSEEPTKNGKVIHMIRVSNSMVTIKITSSIT